MSSVSTGVTNSQEDGCDRCQLALTRTNVVVGRGSSRADVMFLGEAPGQQEDRRGLGFQGAAGRKFADILSFVGLEREEIWLANAVRCRPSVNGRRNRPPTREEIQSCRHWLVLDIGRIRPLLIVTMGRVAFETVTGVAWQADRRAQASFVEEFHLMVYALYHPAYLIYRRDLASLYREDLMRLRALLTHSGVIIRDPTGPWASM